MVCVHSSTIQRIKNDIHLQVTEEYKGDKCDCEVIVLNISYEYAEYGAVKRDSWD